MLSRWSLHPSALVGEKVEGDLGERRGDGHETMGQRLGDAAPNQETPGASEAGRGRGRVSRSADTLNGASGLRSCETIHFCCFRPPPLWSSVTEALGNGHKCAEPSGHSAGQTIRRRGEGRATDGTAELESLC